jgi:hypothetical protein
MSEIDQLRAQITAQALALYVLACEIGAMDEESGHNIIANLLSSAKAASARGQEAVAKELEDLARTIASSAPKPPGH